jgi:hypothetical protein
MARSKKIIFLLLSLTLATGAAVMAWRWSSGGAVNPLFGLEQPLASERTFEASISQRLAAGGYTYVLVQPTVGQSRWIVTLGQAQVGQRVSVEVFGISRRFESRRLNRVFSPLSFASIHPL